MSSLESIVNLQSQLVTQRALLDRLQKAFDTSGFNAELLPFDKKTFTREEGLAIDAFNKKSASAAVAGGFRTVAEFLNKTFLNNIKRAQFELDRIKSEINRISKRIPLVDQVQQITTTDEDQFLHAPTDTFEAIGVQGLPPPLPLNGGEGQQVIKIMNLDLKLENNLVTGRVSIALFNKGFGVGNFILRLIVFDLNSIRDERRLVPFTLGGGKEETTLRLKIPITSNRVRVEMVVLRSVNNTRASNVTNQELRSEGEEDKPPTTTRPCNCRGVIKRVPINDPCPVCKDPPPEPEKKNLFAQIGFETLIIGGLAVAALMPRGDKKK